MKKLFLSFAVIAGFSMISCGNKAENAENAEATDSVVVEEVVDSIATPDSAAVDTAIVVEEVAK